MPLIKPLPILAAALALGLSGCAQNASQGSLFASASSAPKSIIVADFIAASEVTATDNGFNTRLERKGGNYPILERRQRTLARVNDEIVATTVADLHAAGLEARPGNEQSLGFGDDAVLVSGRLRPPERKPLNQVGFGPGRGNVVADMTVTRVSAARREQVMTFATDIPAGRKLPPGNAQAVAARNQTIAATLAAENALPERLSPDVEAQAHALGRAIADKVIAYAKEHDWLPAPQVAQAAPAAAPAAAAAEQRVRIPDPKPVPKPVSARKPVAQKPVPAGAEAPEDEEPPDTNVPYDPDNKQ